MSIGLQYNDAAALAAGRKIRGALTQQSMGRVVARVSWVWHARMIRRTPKRWSGQTRKGWVVRSVSSNTYELTNRSKVMGWLETGTKAHGPKKAKRLFIPLTRRAAQAGARGVMTANAAAAEAAKWANYGLSRSKRKAAKLPYVYGKDFVFAKRVRGIRPMRIVARARPEAQRTLRIAMVSHIREAIRA